MRQGGGRKDKTGEARKIGEGMMRSEEKRRRRGGGGVARKVKAD